MIQKQWAVFYWTSQLSQPILSYSKLDFIVYALLEENVLGHKILCSMLPYLSLGLVNSRCLKLGLKTKLSTDFYK